MYACVYFVLRSWMNGGKKKLWKDVQNVIHRFKSDPSQNDCEFLLLSGVSKQPILTHLAKIGKGEKLDKWIPHGNLHYATSSPQKGILFKLNCKIWWEVNLIETNRKFNKKKQ